MVVDAYVAPGRDDVQSALERIVVHPPFATSPRLRTFLRYVVETTLDGNGSGIKAYTVAVEGLGCPPGFDPQRDGAVRVQALRLRRALLGYYAGIGMDEHVIIAMRRGSYVPYFRWHREVLWDADDDEAVAILWGAAAALRIEHARLVARCRDTIDRTRVLTAPRRSNLLKSSCVQPTSPA